MKIEGRQIMTKFRLIQDGKIVGYERWNLIAGKWCYDNRSDGAFSIQNPFISHTDKEQFTGLLDKNGKDLDWWEGDIFARASDSQIEGTVIYDLGCFWLDRIRGGRTPLYECTDWQMYKIGNQMDNPELLE